MPFVVPEFTKNSREQCVCKCSDRRVGMMWMEGRQTHTLWSTRVDHSRDSTGTDHTTGTSRMESHGDGWLV